MEWLLLALAGAAVGWVVEKVLDAWLERWRRRRATPLTDAQVRRFHRRHFGVAAAMFVYMLGLLAYTGYEAVQNGIQSTGVLVFVALGALAIYLGRVVRRRWRRLARARTA